MAIRFVRSGQMPLTSQAVPKGPASQGAGIQGAGPTLAPQSPPMPGASMGAPAPLHPALAQLLPWLIMSAISSKTNGLEKGAEPSKASSMEQMPSMGKTRLPLKTYLKHPLKGLPDSNSAPKAPSTSVSLQSPKPDHVMMPKTHDISPDIKPTQTAEAVDGGPPTAPDASSMDRSTDYAGRDASSSVSRGIDHKMHAKATASALVNPQQRMYQKAAVKQYALRKRIGV